MVRAGVVCFALGQNEVGRVVCGGRGLGNSRVGGHTGWEKKVWAKVLWTVGEGGSVFVWLNLPCPSSPRHAPLSMPQLTPPHPPCPCNPSLPSSPELLCPTEPSPSRTPTDHGPLSSAGTRPHGHQGHRVPPHPISCPSPPRPTLRPTLLILPPSDHGSLSVPGALSHGHQGHGAAQHGRGLHPCQRGHRPHHPRGAALGVRRETRGNLPHHWALLPGAAQATRVREGYDDTAGVAHCGPRPDQLQLWSGCLRRELQYERRCIFDGMHGWDWEVEAQESAA